MLRSRLRVLLAALIALVGIAALLASGLAVETAVAQPVTPTPSATAPAGYAIERVAPSFQSVSTSQTTFPVGVTVENVTRLGAYEVLLTFDTASVVFVSATDGPFLGSTGRSEFCPPAVLQPVSGTLVKLHFGCGTLGAPPPDGPSGSGMLATLVFSPVAVGTTNLLLDPSLSDAFGASINAVAYGGTVDINTGPTPTSSNTPTPTVTPTPCPGGVCPTPTPVLCSPTDVAVEPQSLSGHPGVVLDVPIVAHNACNLGGFQFTLAYDPALLSLSTVQTGPFLGSTGRAVQCAAPQNQSPSSVSLSCVTLTSPPPAGASGSGTLATVRLVPNAVGQSALALQDVILVMPDATIIPLSTGNGTATITSCATCVTVTATNTPTPVATATQTPTQTQTITPTPCPGVCPTDSPTPTGVVATDTPTPAVVPATVRVDPPSLTGQQGSVLGVPVRIDNAVNLGAFSFRLTWDSSLVSFQGVTTGPFLGSTGRTAFCDSNTSDGPNTVVYSCSTLGSASPGPSGSGILATVNLLANAPGTTALTLSDVTLVTPAVQPIPVAPAVSGTGTIIACSGPCPTPTITPTVSATVVSSGATTVGISPQLFNVHPGDTFTVDVTVSNVANLGSFQFTFDFNSGPSRFVEFVSVQTGPFLGSTGRPVSCPAPVLTVFTAQYGCVTAGTSALGPNGSGLLATLTLRATGPGSNTLFGISGAQLSDPLAANIPVQLAPLGTVNSASPSATSTVTATATPTATPPGGRIAGLAADAGRGEGPGHQPALRGWALGRRTTVAVALLMALCAGAVAWRFERRPGRRSMSRHVRRRALKLALVSAFAAGLIPALGWVSGLLAQEGAIIFPDPLTANVFVGNPPVTINEQVAGVPGDAPVAGFALDIRFDPELLDLTFADGGFLGSTGRSVNCSTAFLSFFERVFACTSAGPASYPTGQGTLARLTVKRKPGLPLRATLQNGGEVSLTHVIGGTRLFDPQRQSIPIRAITDAVVVVRALEGDVNGDCVVNVVDDQDVASRYPATFGSLKYLPSRDLEPAPLGDGDIDIKDLQFVFGRNGSTCSHPIPPQSSPTPIATPALPTPTPTPPLPPFQGIAKETGVRPATSPFTFTNTNLWLCKPVDVANPNLPPVSPFSGSGEPTCGTLLIAEVASAPRDLDTCNDDDDHDGKPCAGDPSQPRAPWQAPGDACLNVAEDYLPGVTAVDCDTNQGGINGTGELPQGLGAFEFQVKFDDKLFQQPTFDCTRAPNGLQAVLGSTGRIVQPQVSVITENWVMFGCLTKNPGNPPVLTRGPNLDGPMKVLGTLTLRSQPDLLSRLRPAKDNGVVTNVLDENCEFADTLGKPFNTRLGAFGQNEAPAGGLAQDCKDTAVTIRMLEGDVNLDCRVDILDDQTEAFRYGQFFGQLNYNRFYDLEPNIAPDFDIDIKDLQTVFGRNGSTCANPIPPQPPQTTLPDP